MFFGGKRTRPFNEPFLPVNSSSTPLESWALSQRKVLLETRPEHTLKRHAIINLEHFIINLIAFSLTCSSSSSQRSVLFRPAKLPCDRVWRLTFLWTRQMSTRLLTRSAINYTFDEHSGGPLDQVETRQCCDKNGIHKSIIIIYVA